MSFQDLSSRNLAILVFLSLSSKIGSHKCSLVFSLLLEPGKTFRSKNQSPCSWNLVRFGSKDQFTSLYLLLFSQQTWLIFDALCIECYKMQLVSVPAQVRKYHHLPRHGQSFSRLPKSCTNRNRSRFSDFCSLQDTTSKIRTGTFHTSYACNLNFFLYCSCIWGMV